MEGDRENFLKQSGADGYISKPVVDHHQFVAQIGTTAKRLVTPTRYPPLKKKWLGNMSHPAPNFP